MAISNKLSVFYQNIRGLRSKTHEFKINVTNVDSDIILVNESWLNNTVSDAELFDSGYTVYRRDRESSASVKKPGGGVLIAVKSSSLRVAWIGKVTQKISRYPFTVR